MHLYHMIGGMLRYRQYTRKVRAMLPNYRPVSLTSIVCKIESVVERGEIIR